ncbi:MAG: aryl-sulfate sulfotransferase, partial [Solirubrobacterales bacterium]
MIATFSHQRGGVSPKPDVVPGVPPPDDLALRVDLLDLPVEHPLLLAQAEPGEVDPQGKVVWRWNSGDHIGLGETPARWWEKVAINSHRDAAGRDRYDIFHLNSIQPIPGGLLLVSARHTDAVFAISRKTGKV